MEKSCLVVVDMQNDFVTGALGSPMAQAIVPALLERVRRHDGPVFFTRDTHYTDYLATREGRMLPVEHCLEGSEGWEIVDPLDAFREEHGCPVFDKETFGSVELAKAAACGAKDGSFTKVVLTGVCTDICVVSNALLIRSFAPELDVFVDASLCAGTSPEAHKAALKTMASCQVSILNEKEGA